MADDNRDFSEIFSDAVAELILGKVRDFQKKRIDNLKEQIKSGYYVHEAKKRVKQVASKAKKSVSTTFTKGSDVFNKIKNKADETAFNAVWKTADFIFDPKGFMQLRAEEQREQREKRRRRRQVIARHNRVKEWQANGGYSHSVAPLEQPNPNGLLARTAEIRGNLIKNFDDLKFNVVAHALIARKKLADLRYNVGTKALKAAWTTTDFLGDPKHFLEKRKAKQDEGSDNKEDTALESETISTKQKQDAIRLNDKSRKILSKSKGRYRVGQAIRARSNEISRLRKSTRAFVQKQVDLSANAFKQLVEPVAEQEVAPQIEKAEELPTEAQATPPTEAQATPPTEERATKSGYSTKKIGDGYVYTIGNGDEYEIPSQNFDKSFAYLKRNLKSAVTDKNYLGVSDKAGNNELYKQSVFLRTDADPRAEAAIKMGLSLMNQPKGAVDENGKPVKDEPQVEVKLDKEHASLYQGKETFYGRESRAELKRALAQRGGRITKTKGDEVEFEYALKDGEDAEAFESEYFKKARELSDARKPKDDTLQEKIRDDSKQANKKKDADAHDAKDIGKAVLTVLFIIANLVRRIVTAMLKDMSERREDGIQGRNIGESATTERNFKHTEGAMGVKAGTIHRAIQSIYDNYGDERHLKTEGMEEIAPWAGDLLPTLIATATTKQKPRVALEALLDHAMEQIKAGKDWKGDYVGEEAARASIIASMKRFDPDAGAILENMYDTNTYGIYAGRANTFAEWLEVSGLETALNSIDSAHYEELAQQVARVTEQFKRLGSGLLVDLANTFEKIINMLKGANVGASHDERVKNALTNWELATNKRGEIDTRIQNEVADVNALAKKKALDFTEVGAKDAEDFLQKWNKDDSKLKRQVENDSRWAAFVKTKDFYRGAAAYKVLTKKRGDLDKELSKPEKTSIRYADTEYTDTGIADDILEELRLKGRMFEFSSTRAEIGQAVNYYGGYNAFIDSKRARAAGLDERFGGRLDTIDQIVAVGKKINKEGLAGDSLINIAKTLNKSKLTDANGEQIKIKTHNGLFRLSNEEIADNIKQAMAQADIKLNSDALELHAKPLIKYISGLRLFDDNTVKTDMNEVAGQYNEDTFAEIGQEELHNAALARSKPQLGEYIVDFKKQMDSMDIPTDNYNLITRTTAVSENKLNIRLIQVDTHNGAEKEVGSFIYTTDSSGLETGKTFEQDIEEKFYYENTN